jgi:hypothetical protein
MATPSLGVVIPEIPGTPKGRKSNLTLAIVNYGPNSCGNHACVRQARMGIRPNHTTVSFSLTNKHQSYGNATTVLSLRGISSVYTHLCSLYSIYEIDVDRLPPGDNPRGI